VGGIDCTLGGVLAGDVLMFIEATGFSPLFNASLARERGYGVLAGRNMDGGKTIRNREIVGSTK